MITRAEKGLVVTAIVVAALSPFVNPWKSYAWAFEPRFFMLMLSATLLGWAAYIGTRDQSESAGGARDYFGISLAVLCAVAALSAIFGLSPAESFTYGSERSVFGLPSIVALAIVAWSASRLRLERHVLWAVSSVVAGGALTAGIVLSERLGGGIINGGFGNSNYAGVVLLLALPVAAMSVRLARSDAGRYAFGAAAVLILAAILTTLSAAVITAAGIMIAFVAFAAPSALPGPLRDRRRATLLGWVTTVSIVAVVAVSAIGLGGVGTSLRASVFGGSAVTRVEMWRQAIQVFVDQPVLGTGPDMYMLGSQPHLSVRQMTIEGEGGSGTGLLVRDPHMLPLRVIASLGIIGLLAALGVLLAYGDRFRTRLAEGVRSAGIRWLLVAGPLCFLLVMMLVPWVIEYAALPALVAGLAIARSNRGGSSALKGMGRNTPKTAKKGRSSSGTASVHTATRAWRRAWLLTLVALSAAFMYLGVSAMFGQAAYQAFLIAPDQTTLTSSNERMLRWQPTRSYLHYQSLLTLGQGVSLGITDFQTYRVAVDQEMDALSGNAVYLANLAQPVLDVAPQSSERTPMLLWAGSLVEVAVRLSPNHPDVALEDAHLALLRGDLDHARSRLGLVERMGVLTSRLLLYRYFSAVQSGDTETAERLAATLRSDPAVAQFVR